MAGQIWTSITPTGSQGSHLNNTLTSAVRIQRRSSASPMLTPVSVRASTSRSRGVAIGAVTDGRFD